MQGEDFGSYLNRKRRERGLTLRDLARRVDLSATYLCDMEKGRRQAPGREVCDRLAGALGMSETERGELYDLSGAQRGGVPADLPEYIMQNPYVRVALRKARDSRAGEEEWLRFIQRMEDRQGEGQP